MIGVYILRDFKYVFFLFFFLHELAINKIPKFNLSLFYFYKIPYVSGLIFLSMGNSTNGFSFPTLLARATYMSCGGEGEGRSQTD